MEISRSKLSNLVDEELNAVIGLRHRIHANPEPGYQEFRTAESVVSFIKDIPGIKIETGIAETGVVAVLGADKPGKCIAFRADMDCLSIEETTGLPYASTAKGWMHACGHDGHTALQAGVVRVLGRMQDELKGPVKFIFQPAEEQKGGGKRMVEAGVLDSPKVDVIFSLHGWPEYQVGQVATRHGAFFASTDSFEITVIGKGGHAAFPHHTVDPVVVASSIVTAAQAIVSRSVNPLDSAVISFCAISGGNTYNVIPDTVTLKGTIRCFDQELRDQLKQRLTRLAEGIADSSGSEAEVKILEGGYPTLMCAKEETNFFLETCRSWMSGDQVLEVPAVMGGEDFAYYAQRVPACFWLLGVRDPGAESWPMLHSSNYDFNDKAMALGIRVQCELALAFQQRSFTD